MAEGYTERRGVRQRDIQREGESGRGIYREKGSRAEGYTERRGVGQRDIRVWLESIQHVLIHAVRRHSFLQLNISSSPNSSIITDSVTNLFVWSPVNYDITGIITLKSLVIMMSSTAIPQNFFFVLRPSQSRKLSSILSLSSHNPLIITSLCLSSVSFFTAVITTTPTPA